MVLGWIFGAFMDNIGRIPWSYCYFIYSWIFWSQNYIRKWLKLNSFSRSIRKCPFDQLNSTISSIDNSLIFTFCLCYALRRWQSKNILLICCSSLYFRFFSSSIRVYSWSLSHFYASHWSRRMQVSERTQFTRGLIFFKVVLLELVHW